MASKITEGGFIKPAVTDPADIGVINANFDLTEVKLGKKIELETDGKIAESKIPALGYIPTAQKGASNGVASLDGATKVPQAQIPELPYIPNSHKGVAGGVAGLDADGKISAENLPDMDYATSGEFLNHATDGEIHVTPILIGNFNTAIAGLMEHADDEVMHTNAGDKANWTQGAVVASKAAADAALALNLAAALESRVARVEDGLFNNITGNPFLASFDTITGIAISKGVWNKASRRIEC